MTKRFLIGQLARFGDCLYVTAVAKQIKHDFPDSHITWAIAAPYRSILELNPLVDEIWEVGDKGSSYSEDWWQQFEVEANKRKSLGLFDELVLTQMTKRNWKNFSGSIRSSVLRGYGRPITVPVDPVLRLSEREVANVRRFADQRDLGAFKNVILFECAPGSGQSSVNVDFALGVARRIAAKHPNTCFILSTNKAFATDSKQILDASVLTFRENAELSKYCTFLVGCSSGITWLCSSDWAKKINMIQLIDEDPSVFAGVAYDLELRKMCTDHILEIGDQSKGILCDVLSMTLNDGFAKAKARYHRIFRPAPGCFRVAMHQLWIYDRSFRAFKELFLNTLWENKHFHFWPLLGTFVWHFLTDPYLRRIEKHFRKKKKQRLQALLHQESMASK